MSRKGENIYKRKDGRWEGRYIKSRTLEGKAKYGYVYARTYKDAKSKLSEAVALNKVVFQTQYSISSKKSDLFCDIALEWLASIQPQVKKSTLNKYYNIVNSYVFPYFEKIPLSNISYECIKTYSNELLISGGVKGKGLSSKTVSDILSVIRSILHYAVTSGKTVSCEMHSIQVKHEKKEIRVLTRSEQEKLCQYLYSDLNAYNIGILVCLFTGLRVGEICALKWTDILFDDKALHVNKTMQRIQDRTNAGSKTKVIVTEPKSSCSVRIIPLPEDLLKIIAEFQTSSTGFFLTGSDEKFIEPRTMQNAFKRALKRSSVKNVNFHVLRHTFATRCVELGFDIKSLSEILGHANVNITMNRYVHPSMELKKENMKRLSVLLDVS